MEPEIEYLKQLKENLKLIKELLELKIHKLSVLTEVAKMRDNGDKHGAITNKQTNKIK